MAHGFAKIESSDDGDAAGIIDCARLVAIYNAMPTVPAHHRRQLDGRRHAANSVSSCPALDMAAMVAVTSSGTMNPLASPLPNPPSAHKFPDDATQGPVVLVVDHDMQERPVPQTGAFTTHDDLSAGEAGAVKEVARFLVAAEDPDQHGRAARSNGIQLSGACGSLQAPVNGEENVNFLRHPRRRSIGDRSSRSGVGGTRAGNRVKTVHYGSRSLHQEQPSRLSTHG